MSSIRSSRKTVVFLFSVLMILPVCLPTVAYALTGGPTQPEVQGFTPVSTAEMVNLFTGDFSYNIPLMDVDGYPVNISYQSGSTMEEEASWVGLGWSLNVGSVNRSMRGLPDDFNGDAVKKEMYIKPSRTFGIKTSIKPEAFGFDPDAAGFNLSVSLGVYFNNYTGFGFEKSVSASISAGKEGKGTLTGGLGLSSDSNNGTSLQPSVGVSTRAKLADGHSLIPGLTLGTSFSARSGVKQLSLTASVEHGYSKTEKSIEEAPDGTTSTHIKRTNYSGGLGSTNSSFNLGTTTYSPTVTMDMKNTSISGRFTAGAEIWGTHPLAGINAYGSSQKLVKTSRSNSAYGYIYARNGQTNESALMDFNREKDGPFVSTTPVLPLANFTYDLFTVTGQGVGGSYRSFRGDVGHVFDARGGSSSHGEDFGVELGGGNTVHNGFSTLSNFVDTKSGRWDDENPAAVALSFRNQELGDLYEASYFREANEAGVCTDRAWIDGLGGYDPVRVLLKKRGNSGYVSTNKLVGDSVSYTVEQNKRTERESRNKIITTLTYGEVRNNFGVYGPDYNTLGISSQAKDHHIAEITALDNDGNRFIYAQPVYNTLQKEVTFAVGEKLSGGSGLSPSTSTNLVTYPAGANSIGNPYGLDNYYSATTTPGYAYSYLLTARVTPDYVDSDTIAGPSVGDLGGYTLFEYDKKVGNYKWRTPVQENAASYDAGLLCDEHDDKASYIYGEKEIWYLEKISSKNYVAIFYTSPRSDARGVNGENGGINTNDAFAMHRLDSICLFTRYAFENGGIPPLKTIHFEYDYSLCQGIPNSTLEDGGKLTLKKIFFTYQSSHKGRLSPYEFTYNDNPDYSPLKMDRWGYYKDAGGSIEPGLDHDPSNIQFPYVNQEADNDLFVSSWLLSSIRLPSGGIISVEYESDDYAYVQNRPAMQMFPIVGGRLGASVENVGANDALHFSSESDPNNELFFKLDSDFDDPSDIARYKQGIGSEVYLRCMVNIAPAPNAPTNPLSFDYIPLYARIDNINIVTIDPDGTGPLTTGQYGRLLLRDVSFGDNGITDKSPISMAAIQFGRLQAPPVIYGDISSPDVESGGLAVQFVEELLNFVTTNDVVDLLQNPNDNRFMKGCGQYLIPGKSFVRLSSPSKMKNGGGARVRQVTVSDVWAEMADGTASDMTYGQVYSYTLGDGTTSGVATYEPMVGADENPFREPIHYSVENMLAPDEARFIEKPIGETFYPSPSVGYSRVTVSNYIPPGVEVSRHGTGRVVQEFYTAKDFPVIVRKTSLAAKPFKTPAASLASLLKIKAKDYMTASQGFAIETNDMHGKQKAQYVFREYSDEVGEINAPISSVVYEYFADPYHGANRLSNTVPVIYPDGTIGEGEVGVHFDMITDMRQEKTFIEGAGGNLNFETFVVPPAAPILVPIPIPNITKETTQFRSVTTTKVIQRFGNIRRVTATDNTSVVATTNIAWDAVTAQVLATETVNNFDDPVYHLTYPAHWYYDQMGPAYKNIGFSTTLNFDGGGVASIANARRYFTEGDEIAAPGGVRGWIIRVTSNTVEAVIKNGDPLTTTGVVKILRSGRRNMSTLPMSEITTLQNPLDQFSSNLFEQVVGASVIEYGNVWDTHCQCFTEDYETYTTTNPYILGTRGVWRLLRNYTYLTDRTQGYYNNNTNIRRDGIFTSFNPFYVHKNGLWNVDRKNWTFASEVTEFSPHGQEIENRDALGRYSAAVFGYNHTLPTAVAANAKHSQIAFNSFEIPDSAYCTNPLPFIGGFRVQEKAHSGLFYLGVPPGDSAYYSITRIADCDDAGCDMSLSVNYTYGTDTVQVAISGGELPYHINGDLIFGNIAPLNILGDDILLREYTDLYYYKLTVTDANGCVATTTLTQ